MNFSTLLLTLLMNLSLIHISCWIDTTFANKGIGVRSICKTLDIALADVMAFGDNYNDVSMLDIVGAVSYTHLSSCRCFTPRSVGASGK